MKCKWKESGLERLRVFQGMIFPLCFVCSFLLNILFFYVGLAYEDNIARKLGFAAGCLLFAGICVLTLLSALRRERLSRSRWLLLGLVLVFFAVCYGAAFWKHGLNGKLLHHAQQFAVFCVPAFCAGIYGAMHRGERTFFAVLESFSFLAFPGAVIYCNSTLFDCLPWNYGGDLGILNYMTLAYTFMPFLLAHIISFAKQADWTLPFTDRKVRRPQLLRGIFIAFYWVAIMASATRGAYVCVAGFCALLVLFALLRRGPAFKPVFCVSAAMALVLLFNLFIYAPPGFSRMQRMNLFLDALKEHQLVTTKEDPSIADRLDELVEMDDDQQVVNHPVDGSEETDPSGSGDGTATLQVHNRGTLFKLAIKEFRKSPLTGMGAVSFAIKYGEYPHNVVFEMLCETGLIGTLLLLPLICWTLIKLLRLGWRDQDSLYLFLFFMAYAIQANLNGSLWTSPALFCVLGYGITVRSPQKEGTGREELSP